MKQLRRCSTLATVAGLLAVALVAPASASRPFNYAELKSPRGDGANLRLVIKTVTHSEKPRRITVRNSGLSADARETERSPGRWVISERTEAGKALIRELRSDLRESGFSRLLAIGYYGEKFGCGGAEFRVAFRIKDLDEQAKSRFVEATSGCEEERS